MRLRNIPVYAVAAAVLASGCSKEQTQESFPESTSAPTTETSITATTEPYVRRTVTVECDDGGKYSINGEGVMPVSQPPELLSAEAYDGLGGNDGEPQEFLKFVPEGIPELLAEGDGTKPVNTFGLVVASTIALESPDMQGSAVVNYIAIHSLDALRDFVFQDPFEWTHPDLWESSKMSYAMLTGLDTGTPAISIEEHRKPRDLSEGKPFEVSLDLDRGREVYDVPNNGEPIGRRKCDFILERALGA